MTEPRGTKSTIGKRIWSGRKGARRRNDEEKSARENESANDEEKKKSKSVLDDTATGRGPRGTKMTATERGRREIRMLARQRKHCNTMLCTLRLRQLNQLIPSIDRISEVP